jgi:hypothetical protein
MAYKLTNLSDEQLSELHKAVWDEKQARVIAKIHDYPRPVMGHELGHVEAIKKYRERTGLTLFEAKTIVDYYEVLENSHAQLASED